MMIYSQTDITYNHRNLFQDVEIQWLTQIPGARSDVECMNPLTFPVWYINIDGTVYDEMKTPLGFFDLDGSVYSTSSEQKLGYVDTNGSVYDRDDRPVGRIDASGMIYDQGGSIIAFVNSFGNVKNFSGSILGSVNGFINQFYKMERRSSDRQITHRAAAGVYLLLMSSLGCSNPDLQSGSGQ
jgi:hypothetical protein